ncbi:MAG: polyphosphate kinase 1 [Methanoregulaceae archaeon]|nr:polyphosphate kinase 1 [Methanoregulaceae archaeon]
MTKNAKRKRPAINEKYFNRESSWLQFNRRVLEEAKNPDNPLLERLKFLAIFESNLDEFYMVRVSGLIEQYESGVVEPSADGLSPNEQLELISNEAYPLRQAAAALWEDELRPLLKEQGVSIIAYRDLPEAKRTDLDLLFRQEIFPVCTPLILDPAPSVPFISNRSLNLVVVLGDETGGSRLARVKIPDVTPRAIRVSKRRHEYVLLEDVIRHNLAQLFPGVSIVSAHMFRVIRDADIEIRELEAGDLIESIEQTIRLRRFGDPVLLEVDEGMPEEVRRKLMHLLNLEESDTFQVQGILGFDVFWQIAAIDKPSLRYRPHHPFLAENLSSHRTLFGTIKEADVIVHHPFDSFRTVEEFVNSAAQDPRVIGIKQTLYRVGRESPIVESLLKAAESGKQVAVLVELKARFDESNNLVWARALERAGVHVTYGFPELKTHCKLCLVVRREEEGIATYAHIGTGNYNPTTARLYTDLGLFTADPEITQDVAELFNYLTGFSKQRVYRRLMVAPINLRTGVLERIRRETTIARRGAPARIMFKLNSLVDPELVDALNEAAEAGVKVDLIVRGICCLRPRAGVHVVSVVGRFLEHSRLLYFENGGSPEVWLGSADLMRRNLDRRIEVLAPVRRPEQIAYLRDELLAKYLEDNTNAWVLHADGHYERRTPGKRTFSVQSYLMAHPTTRSLFPTQEG